MKINEMMTMLKTGRYQAIVKNVAGRRMFLGIERISKRSRKSQVKYMCAPQDLDQLLAQHAKKKAGPETLPEAPSPTAPTDQISSNEQTT